MKRPKTPKMRGRTPEVKDEAFWAERHRLIPYTARQLPKDHPLHEEPAPARPVPGKIDPGIRLAVIRLRQHNIETCQSCEGGPGHSYPEPTVAFYGTPEAGWRAVSVCLAYGLPVLSLKRVWDVLDGEPVGPHWELTFRRRMP